MPTLDPSKPDSMENPETNDPSSQCNLCGSKDFEVLSKVGRGHQPLNSVICRKCGLVWSHPFPIDPYKYYQKDYRIRYKGTFVPRKKHIYRSAHAALDRFNILKKLLKPKLRVLEIGSGGGEFLYLLKKSGCDAFGIEPNEGYAEYARGEYQLDIKTGFLQNTEFQENSFDMVTLWHVFEHMDNPLETLKKISGFLAPEGILVIEVPNVEATCQAPVNTFHTAHLFNFNETTLSRMAELAGFSVIQKIQSGDGGNICQVFRKKGTDTRSPVSGLEGNFEKISRIVGGRTAWGHFLTAHPYSRVIQKVRQWFIEREASKRFSTGREILDKLMEKVDGNSLSSK